MENMEKRGKYKKYAENKDFRKNSIEVKIVDTMGFHGEIESSTISMADKLIDMVIFCIKQAKFTYPDENNIIEELIGDISSNNYNLRDDLVGRFNMVILDLLEDKEDIIINNSEILTWRRVD